jgi:Pyruvate/2-oxoacid:ferredoxin oxidoreductase delta subunit
VGLIYRDVLIENARKMSEKTYNNLVTLILNTPTVDANVVIRCKDCYHFEPFDCPDGWGICRLNGNSDWNGSDHCSYGCE